MMLNDEVVNANDLILQDKNKFSGWNCWAGLHGAQYRYVGKYV